MPLKSAYLLPHCPLLIPEIGKNNYSFFEKTEKAYQLAASEMIDNEVEILVIISPHLSSNSDSFQINVAPEMEINLKDFGYIHNKTSLDGAAVLADRAFESLKEKYKTTLSSETTLDYGSAIPALILKNLNFNPRLLVISIAKDASRDTQLEFSKELGSIIKSSPKNIAVIASGDLSHKLQQKSPGGYSPKGAKFDNKIIEILSEEETASDEIIKIDDNLVKAASECALLPIIGLLGIIDSYKFETSILAYQTEFGIGYLSAKFDILELKSE